MDVHIFCHKIFIFLIKYVTFSKYEEDSANNIIFKYFCTWYMITDTTNFSNDIFLQLKKNSLLLSPAHNVVPYLRHDWKLE
jgi:hypothetical protein